MSSVNTIIRDDFLLGNSYAEKLYFDYAASLPIIDYHNHLSPKAIADDQSYSNITQLWLAGDHYKWRAMRTYGIPEKYITGKASDFEKFQAWAQTVPHTLRNPLFHWTHLELNRYFGVTDYLQESSAREIYDGINLQLQDSNFSTVGLLKRMNVETLCTTDDPTDDLGFHKKISSSTIPIQVKSSFRPDPALHIYSDNFLPYLTKLSEASEVEINSLQTLLEALEKRVHYFHQQGCNLSDHGLAYLPANFASIGEVEKIFDSARKGKKIGTEDADKYVTFILQFLCKLYHKLGWVQQFHLGPLRNNNSRMLHHLGPDTGWDSIGDFSQGRTLSAFLNELDRSDQLAKTILYNINPADNALFAAMTGNFNDGQTKGKVQYGTAWWFLDQKEGIINQLNALSNMSLLSCFVGMVTDSRSFLSFPRHEYFRRILCNLLGQEMQNGELPQDLPWIGKLVQDICYTNAKQYFNL